MKNKIIGLCSLIIFVFLGTSGIFDVISNFLVWLVTLNATQSNISMAGEIFVKVATFVITFIVVKIIFDAIGWYNSDAMKIAYFIISTVLSFVLCYLVMLFEQHIVAIAIVVAIILLILVGIILFLCLRSRKNSQKQM